MKPNTMEKRAVRLRDLYAQAEEHLLRKLGNRFKDVMSATDAPLWYRIKMSEIFQVQTELEQALSELEAASLEMRTALTEAAFALGIDEADKDFNSILSQQGADGIFTALGIDGPTGRSQAITALMDDSEMRFSELHRRILRDTEDAYREVLAESLPFVTMGVETYQDAVKRAMQGFAERGITGFVDKAGRHWGMAEYAEMATRTGLANAQIAGYTQECLRYGYDLVIVSDHSDTCPLCGKWERKILSLTGEKADDPECAGTISEARRAGLFHPNCGHRFVAYIPGQTDKDLSRGHNKEQDATGYKNRQLQRYYERQVRKWKRIQAAALTPEDEREAQFHVKQWQKKLRAHTAAANLPRKYEREGGRVLLSEEAKKIKPLSKLPTSWSTSIESKPNTQKADEQTIDNSKPIHYKLNPDAFKSIRPLITDEVVFNPERIEHVKDGTHPDALEYEKYIPEVLSNPDYIIEATRNKDKSGVALKQFNLNEKGKEVNISLVVRIAVADDPEHNKNSIITMIKVRSREYNRLVKNKKKLYVRPDL